MTNRRLKLWQPKIFLTAVLVLAALAALAAPDLAQAVKLPDPLDVADPYELIGRVIQGVLGVVGTVALLNFVVAGIGIITSQGSSEKLQKHKDNLVWTSIGLALLFAAYAIISYLLDKLTLSTSA